jgi:hypothetical protein
MGILTSGRMDIRSTSKGTTMTNRRTSAVFVLAALIPLGALSACDGDDDGVDDDIEQDVNDGVDEIESDVDDAVNEIDSEVDDAIDDIENTLDDTTGDG